MAERVNIDRLNFTPRSVQARVDALPMGENARIIVYEVHVEDEEHPMGRELRDIILITRGYFKSDAGPDWTRRHLRQWVAKGYIYEGCYFVLEAVPGER